jgi:serine/threonine-protein kinase RsbW
VPRSNLPDPGLPVGSDEIELTIPAIPELLSLPRLTAAALAARAGFDIEEVEDVRLAIEELCLAAFDGRGSGRLELRLACFGPTIEVACTFIATGPTANLASSRTELGAELTEQLLEALTDEHGSDSSAGVVRAWFKKSHRDESPE